MAWIDRIVVLTVAGWLVGGCGDSGSDEDGGASSTGTETNGTGPSPTSTGMMSGTAGTTAGVDGTGSTGSPSTTSTSTGDTTSGPDECEACVADSCGELLGACLAVEECECWVTCIGAGNNNGACMAKCGPRPDEYDALRMCTERMCDVECNGGGGTGTSTGGDSGSSSSSGGAGASADYEPCAADADCQPGLMCNEFFGYCTVDCSMDMCPVPTTGNIEPICSEFSDTCVLPCGAGNAMCPDMMSCEDIGGGNDICVFP